MRKDLLGDALERRSSIAPVEFDSEIFFWSCRVMTGRKNNSSEAVTLPMLFIELPNQSRDSRSGKQIVSSDVDVLDPIGQRDVQANSGGMSVPVSSISRDD